VRDSEQIGDEQMRLWNGPAGRAWVDTQDLLDQMYKPLERLLVEAVATTGSRGPVLDIGCGTGGTTLAVARLLGREGRCTGVDISAPMIAAARARAAREGVPATFLEADVQEQTFEPAGIDVIISRFGVMFFDDPVRAFTNLRRATSDDGHLRFIAWRSAAENPFMTVAERAAAPLLPNLPPRRLDGPGQFAFANRQRIAAILAETGWADVDVAPLDTECSLPAGEMLRYLSKMGPVGMALQEVDERLRGHVIDTIRPAFEPYVHGPDVRFTAACWMVSARARLRKT
jgi:SAM-dependent methyltransferase